MVGVCVHERIVGEVMNEDDLVRVESSRAESKRHVLISDVCDT